MFMQFIRQGDDEKAMQEYENKNHQETKSKKPKPVLMLLVGLGLFLLLGSAGIYLWKGDSMPFLTELLGVQEQEGPRFTFPMNEFQVNLADQGARRYLRTRIYLAFDEKQLQKELERRQVEIRSCIIEILRSTTVSDLDQPDGMQALRDAIVEELNGLLQNGSLSTIYFDEFIIQ